jgi:hypothetical protein
MSNPVTLKDWTLLNLENVAFIGVYHDGSRHQTFKHVRQNAAALHVIYFGLRVDAQRERNAIPYAIASAHCDGLPAFRARYDRLRS